MDNPLLNIGQHLSSKEKWKPKLISNRLAQAQSIQIFTYSVLINTASHAETNRSAQNLSLEYCGKHILHYFDRLKGISICLGLHLKGLKSLRFFLLIDKFEYILPATPNWSSSQLQHVMGPATRNQFMVWGSTHEGLLGTENHKLQQILNFLYDYSCCPNKAILARDGSFMHATSQKRTDERHASIASIQSTKSIQDDKPKASHGPCKLFDNLICKCTTNKPSFKCPVRMTIKKTQTSIRLLAVQNANHFVI